MYRYFAVMVVLVAAMANADVLAGSVAPQMVVQGSNERLPLVMTRVDAKIVGVMADVELTQVYGNRGEQPIEAVYQFPVTRNAAVYALSLRVGDRVVRAELESREQARQTYDQAREQGQTASLLEQSDADVLQLSIANILPGDQIEVSLHYSELLVPESGRYQFFFPNTFGDHRYGGEASQASSMSLSSEGAVVDYALDINVQITTPVSLRELNSPSHDVLIQRLSNHQAEVQLTDADARAAASDFKLDFSLAGEGIETGVLVHQEDDEGWFLLMAEPPAEATRSDVVPREYLFVLDVSGSMSGTPIETAKELMRELVGGLAEHERFNLLLFESRVDSLTLGQSLPPSDDNLERAIHAIDSQFGHGGTNLRMALTDAYALPQTPGYSRTVVVVTDGNIQAGADVAVLINSHLGQANVFAMGIGPRVSNQVVERIARAGRGEAILVASSEEAVDKAAQLRRLIERPLLTDIRLQFEGLEVFDLEPAQVPDVFADRPIVVTGRFHGQATGLVTVTGANADGGYRQALNFADEHGEWQRPAIKRLWARERLTGWMDGRIDGQLPREVDGRVEAVTAHALEYQLLSPWTSFVAVHEEILSDGSAERVVQPSVRRDGGETRLGGVGFDSPSEQLERIQVTGQRVRGTRAHSSAPVGAMVAPPPPVTREGISPSEPVAGQRKTIAGHDLVWRQDRWQSADWQAELTQLRIKRGSEAARKLLALRPDLQPLIDLSEPVLVVINGYAVGLSDEGFSDYPDEILSKLAAGQP